MEVIHPGVSASQAKIVIFDFDGTLSLVRSGWMDVMIPMCVDELRRFQTGESEADLKETVEQFVWQLTGKETIYQMMALARAVRERGGTPAEALAYKKMYLDRLWVKIGSRVEGLRKGSLSPDEYLVPGAVELLDELHRRGLQLYLASGTDDANVKEEAWLLGVDGFFEGRIFGAQDDLGSFSKAALVRQILSESRGGGPTENSVAPEQLLVFGDGFVEIEEVKKAGGVAVGVATSEPKCQIVDEWKRRRLLDAGADFIVPNFCNPAEICSNLLDAPAFVKLGTAAVRS